MREQANSTQLHALEIELALRLRNLAAFLNMALRGAAGNRLLGIQSDDNDFASTLAPEQVDIRRHRIGRTLPLLYDYAYHAHQIQGHVDWQDWATDYDDRQLFGEFLELTDTPGVFTSASDYVCGSTWRSSNNSGLQEMLDRADARHRLDTGDALTIKDIAILADMNERSVRNALRAEGENRLVSLDGEQVENHDALRWLRTRRGGFKETIVTVFQDDDVPDCLSYGQIGPFIGHRISKLFPVSEDDLLTAPSSWTQASRKLQWPVERLHAIAEDIGNIEIDECRPLARVLRVDPAWFTEQVLCALHPKEMELVLFRKEFESTPEVTTQNAYIDVPLTPKGIKNGYLDIPASLATFFPSDCFGGRGEMERGAEIELRFGGTARMTDMRIKSSVTISPRARFISYFNSTLKAKAGDVMRIVRIDERIYALMPLQSVTSSKGGEL